MRSQTYTQEFAGTIRLSINGLSRPRDRNCSLRYREDGLQVQADAVQAFADAVLAAINDFRSRWG